jgi:PhoPQ-activated pathogenicity-related protein
VLYVPNAGHNLQQKQQGKTDNNRALTTLAAFARAQIHDKALPKLSWKHDDREGQLRLAINSDIAPFAARLWLAKSPTRDFRKSAWVEQPAKIEGNGVVSQVALPTDDNLAMFGEVEFELDGLRYCLSTQVRVAERPGK